MKIAFLAPAGAMHRYNGSFGKTLHYAPLTLTTLAALVPDELNADIVIYDETAEKIPLDLNADLICITCITGTAPRCYAYADYYRSMGKIVVLGGVHPTFMPQEAALHADAVMTGFAEFTFPQMMLDYKNNNLKKLYVQGENFVMENNLAPRRDLLNKNRYITTNTVEVIRGCNHICTFCAYTTAFGRRAYKRPIKEVVAEIEALNSKEVLFPDVNLIADREYAKKLFKEISHLKKKWMGLVTSDIGIDDEMISIFKKSGCVGLLIGFESINQESQKFVKKGINKVLEYDELMKKLHDSGIVVQGYFAFGGDDEDISVFERTVEMVIKTKIDLPRYSILTPFPNTQLYNQLETQGRIIERDWAMYDVEHCVFEPKHMTKEQLEKGIEWAWRETYKTSNIAKRIGLKNPHPFLALLTNIGYKGYAKKFHSFTREVMVDNSDIPGVIK